MRVVLWHWIRWLAKVLGLVERVQVLAVDPGDLQYQPILCDHPDFNCEVVRLNACQCKTGANQWIIFFVRDQNDLGVPGVEIRPELEQGVGAVADLPFWRGYTNERGTCEFRHLCIPTRYSIYVDGHLAISNLRTDLPWYEYCNPSDPFSPGGVSGWRVINKPGYYGYHVYLTKKQRLS